MKKLKLKSFFNWAVKTHVPVGNKVVKFREERQLLARFLVIQQSRPEILPKLESTVGDHELSLVPLSMFSVDGSLLLCTDKAQLMHSIENTCTEQATSADEEPSKRILIIDAMAILQSMKTTPGMTKLSHLKAAFVMRISTMSNEFEEVRIIFDRYV